MKDVNISLGRMGVRISEEIGVGAAKMKKRMIASRENTERKE